MFQKMVAAQVPADVVTTTSDRVIVYFHGGFFAIGSAAASVGLAADLARNTRMRVVTVDYRLAPERPYPAAPEDAMTAYRALLEAGQDAVRVALSGNPPTLTWPSPP